MNAVDVWALILSANVVGMMTLAKESRREVRREAMDLHGWVVLAGIELPEIEDVRHQMAYRLKFSSDPDAVIFRLRWGYGRLEETG